MLNTDKWEILKATIKAKNAELQKKWIGEKSTGQKASSAKVVFAINSSILELMDLIEKGEIETKEVEE